MSYIIPKSYRQIIHIINHIYGQTDGKPSMFEKKKTKSLPALPEMCWEDFERLVLRCPLGWANDVVLGFLM